MEESIRVENFALQHRNICIGKVGLRGIEDNGYLLAKYNLFCESMVNKGHAVPTYIKWLVDNGYLFQDDES